MNRWSKIASLFILSSSLWGGACLAQKPQPSEKAEAPITEYRSLSFVQSGGFAGIYRQINVDFAAKRIQMRDRHDTTPREETLTNEDLASITAAVTAAKLPSAHGPYLCRFCADQFHYDITVVTTAHRHQVQWEDGSNAPQTLFDLGAVLRRIAERRPSAR